MVLKVGSKDREGELWISNIEDVSLSHLFITMKNDQTYDYHIFGAFGRSLGCWISWGGFAINL